MSHTPRRALLPLIAAVVLVLLIPGAAGAVVYGLGDSSGQFAQCADSTADCCYADATSCPAGTVTGFWDAPLFRDLTSPASEHRISEVRLFASFDAIDEWNGSASSPACVPSRVLTQSWYDPAGRLHTAGESWRSLLAGLVEAHADGLTPVVSLTGYEGPASRPSWEQPVPDPTTLGGYWDYRCGLIGLLGAVSRLPTAEQPHIWEALNEPDSFPIFRSRSLDQAQSCAITASGAPNGAAKAACDYVIADRTIHGFAGHAQDTLLAGVFSRQSTVYLGQYIAQIARELPGAEFPASWALHDYHDVTSSYDGLSLTPLAEFDQALKVDSDGRARDLWITEAAVLLSSRTPGGNCPASGDDPADTLGACINGLPAEQANDVRAFFAMPTVATAVPITHLFWYQWQGEVDWDSGILDGAGAPRTVWCTFYGSGACLGSPDGA